MVERGGDDARAVGRITHPLSGNAVTIGITGAPGAGKSTLTSALVSEMRGSDESVGVLAIDPSSPFTGGAILGDRVRMGGHSLDGGVFIRSMATRGHLGGLSVAVPDAARVLDAVGLPWVIIETVGVGQVEVEIAGESDTTVVVVNPGWGDAVQANKAGLLEIADIFVVNKADRPGVADTVADLDRMLSMRSSAEWRPPIVATVATTADGVPELWDALGRHRDWSASSGERERRRAARLDAELRRVVTAIVLDRVDDLEGGEAWRHAHDDVVHRRIDPWTAAVELLA
jgi:LAO/AO transport system kinase